MPKSFAHILQRLRVSPSDLLSSKCAVALDGFLNGYAGVDRSVERLISYVASSIPGRSEASVCTRAVLHYGNSEVAYGKVLDLLEGSLAGITMSPESGRHANGSFFGIVAKYIQNDKIVFLLGGESTLHQLYNYSSGHIEAQAAMNLDEGKRQREEMANFQAWIEQKFESHAPWRDTIRVLFGMGGPGIRMIMTLWNECSAIHPPEALV